MQEMTPTKKSRIDEAIRRRKIRRALWTTGILLAVVAVIWLIVWLTLASAKNAPGVPYEEVGREHIDLRASLPKPYNSNPPSSGAHYPSPANWGIYDYEVNDKIFIHNLEHGGIWVAYRSSVPAKVVEDLKGIVNEFGGSKIVMAPRSANDSDIAIVAWTRVLKFDLTGSAASVKESPYLSDKQKDGIRQFYRAFKNHGPEFVPEDMAGVDPKTVQ